MTQRPPAPARPWLPNLLREVADKFGLRVALLLGQRFGGRYLALPSEAHADHPVSKALGQDVLAFLIEQHARNERIVVPFGPRDGNPVLLAMVAGMAGKTANQVAEATGLHIRVVHRLRAKLREQEAAAQPGLFEERESA